MVTQRESLLAQVRSVRQEMGRLLDGMDYCLDWKLDEEEWSVRQVLYHLVDTPPGGIHSVAGAILRGELRELTLAPGITDISGERRHSDLGTIQGEIEAILTGLEEVIAGASDADLQEKAVPVHLPARGTTEVRNLERIIFGSMDYHWRDHLGQLAALREALGLG